MDSHESSDPATKVNFQAIPGKQTIEVGRYTFRVDSATALHYVATSRANGGWGHLGPFLVHPAGAVIAPAIEHDSDLDIQVTDVEISAEFHQEAGVIYDDLLE